MSEDWPTATERVRVYEQWDDGIREGNTERAWMALYTLMDMAAAWPLDNGAELQMLLTLTFWETSELTGSHPRRQYVNSLIFTLATWETLFQLTWEYIKIYLLSYWIDVGYGRDPVIARRAILEIWRGKARERMNQLKADIR